MTSRSSRSTPAAFFDVLYANNRDPWGLETSSYEREKYKATLGALPPRRFRSGLEVGCSIGVLTRLLADCCDALLAIDVAETALAEARLRCRNTPQVQFRRASVPTDWPQGRYDLIVLSEVLYFFSGSDIRRTAHRSVSSLADGGVLVLVNFLRPTDTPCDGNVAAETFIDTACRVRWSSALRPLLQRETPQYRLDLLIQGG
jgi:2-polyprenyl-3-methyl-5-hydroxy-6-metoxy-1,4-benzoquinol methylase